MKRAGALLVILGLLGGCGFRLAGGNSFLPDTIRVIAVKPFTNRTNRPEIEQRVTEEVSREFSKRGRYRVVTTDEGADAVLEGEITQFRTDPVQFNEQGRATRVSTSVTVRATLRDRAHDTVLWSQDNLVFREQYNVPDTETAFTDLETEAMDAIARGAAGAVVTSILEGF